jgi:succinoglycan biosynthesis transport protein ExoP
MRAALEALWEQYDLCLIDAPPVLLSADAESLARIADATILVVEAEGVTLNEVARAAQVLDRVHAPAVAAVLNQVRVYKDGGYFADLIREYEVGAKFSQRDWQRRWMLHRRNQG